MGIGIDAGIICRAFLSRELDAARDAGRAT
jgi:hypothetical protein